MFYYHPDDLSAKPEAVNKKALEITSRVRDKLTGEYHTPFHQTLFTFCLADGASLFTIGASI